MRSSSISIAASMVANRLKRDWEEKLIVSQVVKFVSKIVKNNGASLVTKQSCFSHCNCMLLSYIVRLNKTAQRTFI